MEQLGIDIEGSKRRGRVNLTDGEKDGVGGGAAFRPNQFHGGSKTGYKSLGKICTTTHKYFTWQVFYTAPR